MKEALTGVLEGRLEPLNGMLVQDPQDSYGPAIPTPVPTPDPAFNSTNLDLATEPNARNDPQGWSAGSGTSPGGVLPAVGPITKDPMGQGKSEHYGPQGDLSGDPKYQGYAPYA